MARFNFICEIEVEADSHEEAIETFNLLTGHTHTYVSEIHNLTELGIIN